MLSKKTINFTSIKLSIGSEISKSYGYLKLGIAGGPEWFTGHLNGTIINNTGGLSLGINAGIQVPLVGNPLFSGKSQKLD